MCVCIKETQHSHLEGGGRENSRNQLIRDANRKAVNKRKKRMEKKIGRQKQFVLNTFDWRWLPSFSSARRELARSKAISNDHVSGVWFK